MAIMSRRSFGVRATGALATAAGASLSGKAAWGNSSHFPIGLQLYTVAAELEKDCEGTIRAIAQIGYRQIEGFLSGGKVTTEEISRYAKAYGLGWRSAHVAPPQFQGDFNRVIDQAKALGVDHLVCTTPWAREPVLKKLAADDPLAKAFGDMAPVVHMLLNLTKDDWAWNADLFNRFGEQTLKAGIQFAYHNHNFEFKRHDGVVAYDDLIAHTDPKFVKFELDCGWMISAGYDPVTYLNKYPGRYHFLHIKDLVAKPDKPVEETNMQAETVEVGAGVVDWKSIFRAAHKGSVLGYYVEQEPPYKRPALESIRASYDYLHALRT